MTSIGKNAFFDNGIEDVTIASPTMLEFSENMFSEIMDISLRVPSSLVAAYKNDYYWGHFYKIRCITHTINHIDEAISSCGSGYHEHWRCQYCDVVYEDAKYEYETTLQDLSVFSSISSHHFSDGDNSKCTACGNTFIHYEANSSIEPYSTAFLDAKDTPLAYNDNFNEQTGKGIIEIIGEVKKLGDGAFVECTSLESIVIPSSVTSIGYAAFGECTSLENIIIPSSVTSIGEYAFDYCTSLKSIVIPSSVTSIGEYAFANCEKLTDITIESTTMLEWKPAMFTYPRYSTLRVPSSLVAEYKSAYGWKDFSGIYCITHPEIVNDQCNVCGEEVDPIQNGDINGDGKFTIEDLALLINILNGKATDTFGTADVYPDKKLDMKDVETLKDLILGKKVTRAYTKLFNEYFAPVVTQIDIEQVDGECPNGAFRMNDAGTVWAVLNNGDYTKICIQTNSPKIELFEAKNLFKSFSKLTSINGLDMLDVSCVSDLSGMFYYCAVKSLDLSNWDVSNVTNMSAMFTSCMGITTLDLSNWDVSNVTNMGWMFSTCNHLTEIKLSNWDVSNVTDMSYLFSNALNLRTLDLTGWDTSSVTNMNNVFDCTYSLKTVYLGKNFKIPSTTTNFIKVLMSSYEIHCPASLKSQIEALTADCQFKPTIITDVE